MRGSLIHSRVSNFLRDRCRLNELTRKLQLVQDQFEQSDRAYRETK